VTETSAPKPERQGGRVVVLLVLGLGALVAAGYGAAYVLAEDRVPRGTEVAGVPVGGMTSDEAEQALADGLEGRADGTVAWSVQGEQGTLDAEEAGLSVDVPASVEQVGGRRSWDPAWLWSYFTGGEDVDAVVEVDEQALDSALAEATGPVTREPRDGRVEFRRGTVVVTDARVGRELDDDQARAAVEEAYLSDEPAELELATSEPEIDEADVQAAVDEFANPAMAGPVTLAFGEAEVRLTPQQYGRALRMVPEDGVLVPEVDRKALFALVDENVSGDGEAENARIVLRDGRPRVIPSKPGVTYRPPQLARTFLAVVAQDEGRRGKVKGKVQRPDFTTRDARALGVKEKVSTFTTYYPHAEYRNVNIGRAAQIVDGTLLKPGETFSLNGTVGERTRANGFTEGFIISNGVFKEDLGGGVSQLATTLFNAMFFAGLEDVEHKPHSFYISRYPVGREATVAWGAVDLRFRNDTDHGVLIDTSVDRSTPSSTGSVTVTMWSTKVWDITTRTSDRYNRTQPDTRRLDTADCYPNEGYGGFDIDVKRFFRRPGSSELVRTQTFTTTYTPSDTVICTDPAARSS
jgi:vancomycin resistance protein YoaR